MDKKRILVIEDEQDLALMIQTRLEISGYEVLVASDGQAGLTQATDFKPDLIMLDIILPNLDGYQVCQKLKQNPITEQIPIIILTASGLKDVEEKCLLAGANFCTRKPFNAQKLLEKIQELISG